MHKKILLLIIIVLFFIGWSDDPAKNTPVCIREWDQGLPEIIPNGNGGTFISWIDMGTDWLNICVQQFDSQGNNLWKKNGVAVCIPHGNVLTDIKVIADGSGGAIFTWPNEFNNSDVDIYVQGIDSSGKKFWPGNGKAVCTAGDDQRTPDLISDGAGGAIVAWRDKRSGSYFDVYAQRVDAGGNVLWKKNGIAVVKTSYYSLFAFKMTTDGSGGAIIAWTYKPEYSRPYRIYLQRIDSSGVIRWGKKGIVLQSAEVTSINMIPVKTGGVIIAYAQPNPGNYQANINSVFAQRIDGNGNVLWDDWGVRGGFSSAGVSLPHLVTDGRGGAIISWKEANKDIFAQRVDAQGDLPWGSKGVEICTGGGKTLILSDMAADGCNGAVIAWMDGNFYAQRVDPRGEILWGGGGVAVSTSRIKQHGRLAADSLGGAVFTWHTGIYDIQADVYAQNICADGKLGDCPEQGAVIAADRFGGIAPAVIHFDGSGSFVGGGTIVEWEWDFGDGSKGGEETVSHDYDKPGNYTVSLRVKDDCGSWSAAAEEEVRVFSPGSLDAKIEFDSPYVKANGNGLISITAACHEKTGNITNKPSFFSDMPARANHSRTALPGNPVTIDLGLTFETTAGTLEGEVIFDPDTGYYTRHLLSGAAGTANVSAIMDGYVLASGTVEFAWPLPPVNLQVELKENRSLFMGEYHAHLSWAENPDEVFTPAKYRIYRSTNGGAFELVGEVDATVFSYVDASLPAGSSYNYAVSMVDTEDDESPTAQ